ncbi:DoxX family membrane protein, partial [bacterium]
MAAIRISRRQGFPLFGNTVEDGLGSLGLLVIRLVFGYGILLHGLPKIQNPFHWGDKMGLPAFLQLLAALAEFGGGLAL